MHKRTTLQLLAPCQLFLHHGWPEAWILLKTSRAHWPLYGCPRLSSQGRYKSGSVIEVVVGTGGLLLLVLDRVHLVDARAVVGGVAPECDVQVLQE